MDGFDLVGHEDSLRPLHDYAKDLHRVLEEAKEKKIDAQYVMHAGICFFLCFFDSVIFGN